jgi:hypothetical protein
LEEGGTLRIIVPDAGKYLGLYPGDWTGFVPVRPLSEDNGRYRDHWLDNVYKTKMEFINEVFRQGTEHKYAYDAETLILRISEAGFSKVIKQKYLSSISRETLLDTYDRRNESLYVEAVK